MCLATQLTDTTRSAKQHSGRTRRSRSFVTPSAREPLQVLTSGSVCRSHRRSCNHAFLRRPTRTRRTRTSCRRQQLPEPERFIHSTAARTREKIYSTQTNPFGRRTRYTATARRRLSELTPCNVRSSAQACRCSYAPRTRTTLALSIRPTTRRSPRRGPGRRD